MRILKNGQLAACRLFRKRVERFNNPLTQLAKIGEGSSHLPVAIKAARSQIYLKEFIT
jgi:hypothetical protein